MSPFPNLWLLGGIFFLFKICKKLLLANSGKPDQTPHFAVSDLVLHCLPLSHKKDTRFIWVNRGYCKCFNILNTLFFPFSNKMEVIREAGLK